MLMRKGKLDDGQRFLSSSSVTALEKNRMKEGVDPVAQLHEAHPLCLKEVHGGPPRSTTLATSEPTARTAQSMEWVVLHAT